MSDFGTISPDGPQAAVRFERWYPVPVQQLWHALTDPRRMGRWLGAEASLDHRVGGAVGLRWASGDVMAGVITVFEPDQVLEYTWRVGTRGPQSLVRFTLRPERSGTL